MYVCVSPLLSRPLYRIATCFSDEQFYIVAFGEDASIFENEWKFCVDEIPALIEKEAPNMHSNNTEKWVVAYFTKKAMLEMARNMPDSSDDEEEDDKARERDNHNKERGGNNGKGLTLTERVKRELGSTLFDRVRDKPRQATLDDSNHPNSSSLSTSSPSLPSSPISASPALILTSKYSTIFLLFFFNTFILLLRDAQPLTFGLGLITLNVLIYILLLRKSKNKYMLSVLPVPSASSLARLSSNLAGAGSIGNGGTTANGGKKNVVCNAIIPNFSATVESKGNPRVPPNAIDHFASHPGNLVKLRQLGYTTTRRKDFSEDSMYTFLAAEVYKTDKKIDNVCRYVTLPLPPGIPYLYNIYIYIILICRSRTNTPGYQLDNIHDIYIYIAMLSMSTVYYKQRK